MEDLVASTMEELLAQVRAGKVVGVAFSAVLAGGGVTTGFVGDLGGRTMHLFDARTGERTQLPEV